MISAASWFCIAPLWRSVYANSTEMRLGIINRKYRRIAADWR
jgi:hypothetical protein